MINSVIQAINYREIFYNSMPKLYDKIRREINTTGGPLLCEQI